MDEGLHFWPLFRSPGPKTAYYGKDGPIDPVHRIARTRRRAQAVVAWFQQNPPGEDLRLTTRPKLLAPEWPPETPAFELMCRGYLQELVVDSVCNKRAALVDSVLPASSLKGVRFLLYEADEQVADGSSEFSSRGFFDVHDEPGWATWIDHHHDHKTGHRLLCCIPAALVEAAQAGIDGNPVDCIRWAACPELISDSEQ
jgi:hypothetical protein